MRRLAGKLFEWAKKYERHVAVGALLGGFLFDWLTLGRPDQLFGNIILGGYLLVSIGCIVYLSRFGGKQEAVPLFLIFLLQFSFGNLAGGLLVLYGQSGTFEGSSLFLLLFGGFIIGNEFLRQRYARLNFHISAWFFLLFAYLALLVPVYLKRVDEKAFLVSGLLSLGIVALVLLLLYLFSPLGFRGMKRKTAFSLAAIFIGFNALYFWNVIPPVPLSLQKIGIYHSVIRTGNSYEVTYEEPPWYQKLFRNTNETFTYRPGTFVYCFSSVFAPAGLAVPVYHRWEHYNMEAQEWETATVLSFTLNGGREEGYRGYSQKSALSEGKWRCSVETERGALIGRTTFTVTAGSAPVLTKTLL